MNEILCLGKKVTMKDKLLNNILEIQATWVTDLEAPSELLWGGDPIGLSRAGRLRPVRRGTLEVNASKKLQQQLADMTALQDTDI